MLERLANYSFLCFLDGYSGCITKSLSILMTKAKPHLHVPMEPMPIVECLSGYVMHLLIFKDV